MKPALQTIIDRVAEQSAGQPIDLVRDRVVESLRESGFVAPSESWVDAVAREAVHGRAYAVNLEALVGHELTTAAAKQLEDAPAELRVAPSAPPPGPHSAEPTAIAEGAPPKAWLRRPTARPLLALVGAFLVVLVVLTWRCRRDARPTSGHADD